MARPNRPHGMERSAGTSSQVIDSSMLRKVGNVDIEKRHARQAEMSDNASHVLGRHVCASIWTSVTP